MNSNSSNPSLWSLTSAQWRDWLAERGHPAYRADQVMKWLFQHYAESPEAMSVLPKALRAEMAESFDCSLPRIAAEQHDSADDTRKLLLEFSDGERVETVRMPRFSRRAQTNARTGEVREQDKQSASQFTACLSTQAGCQYACRFCASGQSGLKRNLGAGEIVGQVLSFFRQGMPIHRIVFMGSGEPLHNYDELRKAIDVLTDEKGLNLSPRKLTISTVGLVPEIYRMAKEGWKAKLALSLHATKDNAREKLIPLARGYRLDQLKDALLFYQRRQDRRLTFEYLMINGFNDSLNDADRLKKLSDGLKCHINLIPYNATPRTDFKPTPSKKIEAFRKRLRTHGLDATVRYSRGRNIDAACGQLRQRYDEDAPDID